MRSHPHTRGTSHGSLHNALVLPKLPKKDLVLYFVEALTPHANPPTDAEQEKARFRTLWDKARAAESTTRQASALDAEDLPAPTPLPAPLLGQHAALDRLEESLGRATRICRDAQEEVHLIRKTSEVKATELTRQAQREATELLTAAQSLADRLDRAARLRHAGAMVRQRQEEERLRDEVDGLRRSFQNLYDRNASYLRRQHELVSSHTLEPAKRTDSTPPGQFLTAPTIPNPSEHHDDV